MGVEELRRKITFVTLGPTGGAFSVSASGIWGVLTVCFVAAAVGAGCGGNTDTEESARGRTFPLGNPEVTVLTASSSTKKWLVSYANRICRVSRAQIQKRFTEFAKEEHQNVRRGKAFADAVKSFILPGIEIQFDEIHHRGAASGENGQVEEMLGALQFAIESGEKRGISSPGQLTRLFTVFNRLVRGYGAQGCVVNRGHYGVLWQEGSPSDP